MPGFDAPTSDSDTYLTGRFLLAMPSMQDERFQKTVIYMCAHGPEGAMGLVVNKPLESISFPDLLEQLDITMPPSGEGIGPAQSLLALGYAGWGPGQLDDEIKANGWLSLDSDPTLLFETDVDDKWTAAMRKLGIDPLMLSDEAGHA